MPLLMVILAGSMFAQAYDEKIAEYRGPAIQLGSVHGSVEHEGAGGRVTVSIFTDVDHKLVASVTTKKKGHFAFPNLPMGRYRLVATGGDACPLNVPIDVMLQGRFIQHGQLVLHMKPQTPKSCSMVSFERSR